MDTLFENPLPAILMGGLMTAMLATGWLKTGHRSLLAATGLVVLLTIIAVLVERFVETDREKIAATLHQIASLVQQNRIAEAVQYAHSESPQIRRQAEQELIRYDFSLVSIKRNLTIEVDPKHDPPKAEAEFNVVVVLNAKEYGLKDYTTARFCQVTFLREDDGRWRVAAYSHHEPQRGWMVEEKWPPDQPRPPGASR